MELVLDTARHRDLQQPVAQRLVVAAQDHVAAVDHRHLRAERIEDAGELHRDVARALHHQPPRQLGEVEHLVRGDAMLIALELGHDRPGAGRNEQIARRDRPPRRERHRVRTGDGRALVEMLDLVVVERVRVSLLEPIDIAQHGVAQHRPFERHALDRPAVVRRVLQLLGEMRAVDEELLGHAAADHAGAANTMLHGDGDASAVRSGYAARAHPARARADDEEVVIVVWHEALPDPATLMVPRRERRQCILAGSAIADPTEMASNR